MHLFMLALWAVTLVWFNPRLFGLLSEAESVPASATLLAFLISLDVFWLFGSYYIAIFVFSFLPHKDRWITAGARPDGQVAVLYLTRDDFKEEAALSCVQLSYQDAHVFLLDDSTDPEFILVVDRFHQLHLSNTTVVRRIGRKGFKAGSINNALRTAARDYAFFAVVDADGVTPPDFLQRIMPYFEADPTVGFVQGSQEPNPVQKTKFAGDLAPGILPLWTTYYPPRNKYGLVFFLGHGGVIRREAWESVGGFPELSAEDLAFSTKVREQGYQGWFTDDVKSYEDFPESYRHLRSQQERYMKGGCEYLSSGLLQSFLRSSKPAWFEKLDLVLWLSTLYLPILYLTFLLVYAVSMPIFFARSETLELSLGRLEISLWTVFPLSEEIQSVWTWDFFLITVLNVFAPVLGSLRPLVRHPLRTIKLLILSCVPYLSLSVVSLLAVITFIANRRVEWNVTGARSGANTNRGLLSHTSTPVVLIEVCAGLALTAMLVFTFNAALLVYALSLLMTPVLLHIRWERSAVVAVVPIPYLLMALAMGSVGFGLWGLQGISYSLFPFHL
jgi:cellulose synthase/poly-beta-1,6-N-acetylglucosamine synthase-like glycosyltransferase